MSLSVRHHALSRKDAAAAATSSSVTPINDRMVFCTAVKSAGKGAATLRIQLKYLALADVGRSKLKLHKVRSSSQSSSSGFGNPSGIEMISVPRKSATFHIARSEERRVGKEWRSRWSPYH